MSQQTIIFEQPANELIRVSLRLEHLFKQLDQYQRLNNQLSHRDTLRVIVDIINILDRPDLKSKFTQEFHRLISIFSKLHSSPRISQSLLDETLKSLKELLDYFVACQGKIAQSLRDNEFIASIRQHLASPGGDCSFYLPAFYYWLQQPVEAQQQAITQWLSYFENIRAAVDLLLRIVRESAEEQPTIAAQGYFHDNLNTQPATQLLRISISSEAKVFPEVSIGKHRMNIRFLEPSIDGRATQAKQDIHFGLTVCNI